MVMKIKSLIIGMVCAMVILPVFVFATPQLPHIFYGDVTNDGNDLPVDTVIIAKVDGVEKGRITVSVAGEYGGPNALDGKLLVQGGLNGTDVVKFYIGNNVANGTGVHFTSGDVENLDLTFDFDKVTVDSTALTSLVTDGTFSVTGSNTSASTIEVVQKTLLNVGSNTVTLPQGTDITKVGGGNFDATSLTAAETAVGSLSGLGTGVVAKGALQWGIASLGLEFNPAISIKIFVGTSLNGQTLDITRSTSGSSGWTGDGIVSPGTCVVASGYCSFSATKASYYVASETTTTTAASPGGGGGSYTSAEETYTIGDINGSSKVDKYDFALMMSAWGKTGTGLAADLNSDGKVDKYDFALLMLNWGK